MNQQPVSKKDVPSIKASYLKESLRLLSSFRPDQQQAVRALLPAGVFSEIESAAKIEWLPVELDVMFTEALDRVLGESGVRKLSHDAMVRSTEGPLTGPFLRGTLRLFGLSPAHLLKLANQFWQLVYRNCGHARTQIVRPGEIRLELFDIPPIIANSPPYLTSIIGGIEGVLTLTRAEGKVVLDSHLKSAGHFTFTVEWSKP